MGGKKTGKNPTDRGKQGVKRSLLVDGKGMPIGVAVDGANRHDSKLVPATLESIPRERPQPPPSERHDAGGLPSSGLWKTAPHRHFHESDVDEK